MRGCDDVVSGRGRAPFQRGERTRAHPQQVIARKIVFGFEMTAALACTIP